MLTIQKLYAELLALTQLYLLQEYKMQDWITADRQNHAFFQADIPKLRSTQTDVTASIAPIKTIVTAPSVETLVPAKMITQKSPAVQSRQPNALLPIPLKSSHVTVDKEESESAQQPEYDLSVTRRMVKERYPGQIITDEIPSDAEAKRISSVWKQNVALANVVILSFDTNSQHNLLLENIAKALEKHNLSTVVLDAAPLEVNDKWPDLLHNKPLRLILANGTGVHGMPKLMRHYREVTKTGSCYLDQVPVHLMPDLSLYLKEPHLKTALWKTLRNLLNIS